MMSALRLVPGVAPLAVETPAGTFNAAYTLVHHPVENHLGGNEVFDAGPCFGIIRERNLRPLASSIVADQERRLVVDRVNALN